MIRNYAVALSALVGLFTLIGFVAGGYTFLDQRYTLAAEHRSLEVRVSVNELNYVYRKSLEDLFFYRGQLRLHPNDDNIKLKLEEASSTCEKIKGQLAQMELRRARIRNFNSN